MYKLDDNQYLCCQDNEWFLLDCRDTPYGSFDGLITRAMFGRVNSNSRIMLSLFLPDDYGISRYGLISDASIVKAALSAYIEQECLH